jgi:hypothetical protein
MQMRDRNLQKDSPAYAGSRLPLAGEKHAIILTGLLDFRSASSPLCRGFRNAGMWKKNFLFRAAESTPLAESENELFHDTEPALDSAGLVLDKFLSVWVQGEGAEEQPSAYTSLYVRTAMLDVKKHISLLQPLQGRSHQIKQLLTPDQKQFLRQWLQVQAPQAWESSDDHFRDLFELE